MSKDPYSLQQARLQQLLRTLRQKAGLRQKDLAQRLGVPQSSVSKYESGERRVDFVELRRICIALGVPMGEFVRLFEEPPE